MILFLLVFDVYSSFAANEIGLLVCWIKFFKSWKKVHIAVLMKDVMNKWVEFVWIIWILFSVKWIPWAVGSLNIGGAVLYIYVWRYYSTKSCRNRNLWVGTYGRKGRQDMRADAVNGRETVFRDRGEKVCILLQWGKSLIMGRN